MVDFNISNKISDDLILGHEVQLLLQQVDMLFGTEPMDVLGDDSFGSNYDKFLYSVGMSNSALESRILSDIQQLDLFGFTPKVSVTLLEGTKRDIALIDITFTGEYDEFNKTYVIK